jgi:cation diffusion facilitator CzcD-associated flavoprotein CzcO
MAREQVCQGREGYLVLVVTNQRHRYPGCKCDIPAHNYAYSFEPKPDWPNYYATSQQIHQYMHEVADKYDCKKYIKLQHAIQEATWDEISTKWRLSVKDADGRTFVDHVDVFINAGGVLKSVTYSQCVCN